MLPAQAAPDDLSAALNAIADCESGDRLSDGTAIPGTASNAENPTSTASGYFQIIDGTWAAYGGPELTGVRHASEASYDDQLTIAERIAQDGLQAWNASRNCWEDVVDATPVQQEEPVSPMEDVLPTDEIPVAPESEPVPAPGSPPPAFVTPGTTGETITIQPGDTLSGVAPLVDLPSWEPLYAVNTHVIADPDLIFPGQVLQLPEGAVYHGPGGRHRAPEEPVVEEQAAETEVVVPIPPDSLPSVPQTQEQAQAQVQTQQGPTDSGIVGDGVAAPLAMMHVTSPFGATRGRSAPHQGTDFRAPLGTPIYAMMGGTVLEAEPATGAGWWVVVAQDDGTLAAYMHLFGHEIYVSPGQRIEVGTHIADSGDNGSPGQPHLHLGIKVGKNMSDWNTGRVVNPEDWLATYGIFV